VHIPDLSGLSESGSHVCVACIRRRCATWRQSMQSTVRQGWPQDGAPSLCLAKRCERALTSLTTRVTSSVAPDRTSRQNLNTPKKCSSGYCDTTPTPSSLPRGSRHILAARAHSFRHHRVAGVGQQDAGGAAAGRVHATREVEVAVDPPAGAPAVLDLPVVSRLCDVGAGATGALSWFARTCHERFTVR
jgi:hypothetical protein